MSDHRSQRVSWRGISLALLSILVLLTADVSLYRFRPTSSAEVTAFDLVSSGGIAWQGKIVVRRDRVDAILKMIRDASNPLGLSEDEARLLLRELGIFEDLLSRGLWSCLRFLESLPADRRDRLGQLRQSRILVQTAMRSDPRRMVQDLEMVFGPLGIEGRGDLPPQDWNPEEGGEASLARWSAWINEDRSFIRGSDLLDFSPAALVLALLEDQRADPHRSPPDLEQARYAGRMLTCFSDLDRRWNLIEGMVRQGDSRRADLLPAHSEKMVSPEQWNDLSMAGLMASARQTRRHLELWGIPRKVFTPVASPPGSGSPVEHLPDEPAARGVPAGTSILGESLELKRRRGSSH